MDKDAAVHQLVQELAATVYTWDMAREGWPVEALRPFDELPAESQADYLSVALELGVHLLEHFFT